MNIQKMMQQAQQMQENLQRQLKQTKVEATAGGGMVTVEVNGLGDILKIHIDATLVESRDAEMMEDLCAAATNQAIVKSRQLHAEAMQNLTADFNMPQLTDALSQVIGKTDKDS